MTECSSGHLRSPEKWRLAAPSGGEGRELCAPVPANDAVSGPPLGMRSAGHMGGPASCRVNTPQVCVVTF